MPQGLRKNVQNVEQKGCAHLWMCYNTRMNDTHHDNSISAFARLLATENIRVVHNVDAHTASFNMVDRVLTLPRWDNMTPRLYDMLVGHEVAHALFTDSTVNKEKNALQGCVDIDPDNPQNALAVINVVEDARIERLIKAKYPGLKRDFSVGYKHLYDMDIFQIAEQGGVSNMGILDRINLHFKLGILGILEIPFFNDEERSYLDRIEAAQTWEDVIAVSRDLYQYALRENAKMNQNSDMLVSAGGSGEDGDGTQQQDEANGASGDMASKGPDLQSKTQDAFDRSKENKSAGYRPCNNSTIDIPDINLDHVIVPMKKIGKDHYGARHSNYGRALSGSEIDERKKILDRQYELCDEFMNSEKSTVNYMIKQFEMRKAADEHRRTSIQKSGRLDTIKMINYKWSEDIFAKNAVVHTGKNHGFVIVLDWSGSMNVNIMSTVRQAITLAMFCRRANIPFDLYAFTDRVPCLSKYGYDPIAYETDRAGVYNTNTVQDEHGAVVANGVNQEFKNFRMLNFLTSSCNNREFVDACRVLFSLAANETYSYGFNIPQTFNYSEYQLGGTPLEEALVFLHHALPVFRARHKVQILNTVILTDGESCGGAYVLHNPKTRMSYGNHPSERASGSYGSQPLNMTMLLLKSLKQSTRTNIIGMYLTNAKMPYVRGLSTRWLDTYNIDASATSTIAKSWKDNRFFVVPAMQGNYASFMDAAYVIDANLDPEQELNLPDSASTTRTQLRNAFVKGMKTRSMSRILTNRFVDNISS